MSKKQGIIITIISLASLCLSVASLAIALRQPVKEERDIQYVVYLGTNDKDSNEAVYSPSAAKM